MKTLPTNNPLTNAELDRIGDFLKGCKGGRVMQGKSVFPRTRAQAVSAL